MRRAPDDSWSGRRLLALLAWLCVLWPVVGQAQGAPAPPRLVVEAGGHTAIIRALLFTADGRELISVGDDQTIRIWSVAPDGRQAALTRTLRGALDDGDAGTWYAAALAPPDARGHHPWLAVAGVGAGLSEADRYAVRVHDYRSGEIIALLRGHRDKIFALAVAPSGRWLASAGKDNTIRLWDMTQVAGPQPPAALVVLSAHTEHIYGLAWSPTGDRLASASYDTTVGLWDTTQIAAGSVPLLARLRGHQQQVQTVAFHPAGRVLASGGIDQTIRLWQAQDGAAQGVWAHAAHEIAALSFAPDGHQLLAGRLGGRDTPKQVTLYAYPTGTVQHRFTEQQNIVLATAFHPSGQWVATGGGNEKAILLWDAHTGAVLSRLQGRGATVWAVGFAPDGRSISWGQTFAYRSDNERGPLEERFDLTRLVRDRPGPALPAQRGQAQVQQLSLTPERSGPFNYAARLHIQRRGQTLGTIERGVQDGYQHTAYTFTPDGQSVLSGGFNGVLTWHRLDGTVRARLVGHTGEIKAIAVSADGHWALSGAADQTLNLWSLVTTPEQRDITPTLRLFPATDGAWVAWTPQGYFAASGQGAAAGLIGYSLNQGLDKLARYVSLEQLYEDFYRPDLVLAAVQRAPRPPEPLPRQGAAPAPPEKTVLTVLQSGPPPRLTFVVPDADTVVTSRDLAVRIRLADAGGGIGKVVWKMNEVLVPESATVDQAAPRQLRSLTVGVDAPATVGDGALVLTRHVTLQPGVNRLEVIAYNQRNEVASPVHAVTITRHEPPPPVVLPPRVAVPPSVAAPRRPALYIVAVGIDQYRGHQLQTLRYAASDARALVQALRQVGQALFETITPFELLDAQATHQGLATLLGRVATQAQPQDVLVLYLAGHGVVHEGVYYFLPHDVSGTEAETIRREAITQHDLQRWLAQIQARQSVVLLDTCQSGDLPMLRTSLQAMAEQVAVDKLTRATGRAIIAATTATQGAVEGYEGHGLFTYTLLEALRTAKQSDGQIRVYDIAAHVQDRVPVLAQKLFGVEQTPVTRMDGRNFALGLVQAQR